MRKPVRLAALAAFLATPLAAQSWEPWFQHPGDAEGDLLGYAVSPIADLDGDGRPDLLVGVYGADAADPNSGAPWPDAGAVEVLSGADGSVLLHVDGDAPAALLGAAVADLGDLDGDGLPEFAAGAPFHSGTAFFAGRVYVFRGSDGLVLDVISSAVVGELLGGAVVGVDTDGDGRRELVAGAVGANGGAGEVRIYAWNGAAMVLQASVPGTAGTAEAFGYALAGAGDQDGVPGEEFLAGAPFAGTGEEGRVDLVGGGAVLLALPGAAAGDHLGFSVAGNRDVDGDGWPDLAAGAPDGAGGAGEVRVWQGGPTGGTPALLAVATGDGAGDRFGHAVALLDDNNFDGLADVAVGAPDAGGAGLVRVLDVNRATPRALQEVAGKQGDRLGWAVAAVGDLDRQGREELALGAPWAGVGGVSRRGRVDVWRSLPPDSGGGGNEIRPFQLDLPVSILDERTSVDFTVANYRPGVDLFLYVGTEQTPFTTPEGFELAVSNAGGTAPDLVKVVPGVTGSSTVVPWFVPPTYADGQDLFFQAVEANLSSRWVWRASNVETGTIRKPLLLEAVGGAPILDATTGEVLAHHALVNADLGLLARNANPNQDAYFYYSMTGPGSSQMNGFDLGLNNPTAWPGSPVQANQDGVATAQTITVPPTVVGRSIWVQAASDAPVGPAKKISQVLEIRFWSAP